MKTTLLMGAFTEPKEADEALTELEHAGYTADEISIISSEGVASSDGHADSSASTGKAVGTGAVVGGLAGLLAAVVAFPAVTGLIIGGPVVAALGLAGAATGAATGGLVGALTAMGISKETAKTYGKVVDQGGVIIGVSGRDDATDEGRAILEKYGAQEIALAEIEAEAPDMAGEAAHPAAGRTAARPRPAFGERVEQRKEHGARDERV
ncbi:MAG: signal transduction histidine kinase [Patescibacteria group bacterium]|nr:signal transduction histidine kinase [Patescibacteria group bacterium]